VKINIQINILEYYNITFDGHFRLCDVCKANRETIMFQTNRRAVFLTLALMMALPAMPALAKDTAKWIPTWYASPEPSGTPDAKISDKTLRQIVRVSAGGTAVRLRLSNAYGAAPLKLEDIHVAKRISASRIDAATDQAVTFNGRAGVTVAPGAYALSDPLPMKIAADRHKEEGQAKKGAPGGTVNVFQSG
jgi:hypothetical protein